MTQVAGLLQDLPVGLDRLCVELERQLLAQIAARGVLDEWDEMGVGESHLELARLLVGLERLGEAGRQAIQLLRVDEDVVLPFVDVLLEADPELDQALGPLLDPGPRLG